VKFLNDSKLEVTDGLLFDLSKHPTDYTANIADEEQAEKLLKKANKSIYKEQRKLNAADNHSVLCIFQAMDAAGKDSAVRSVFTGVSPACFKVTSFKAPSKEQLVLVHDFLWRRSAAVPARGMVGIFNRSHYEEVLVCKVHPGYVVGQNIPGIESETNLTPEFWTVKYKSIKTAKITLRKIVPSS
jgi:polyphosphate kinase 2 (PPK2 family)|tara:strand:+ start:248 stop:802 length:555 start_codon:yes stop_codon:yes gene_type:complete